MIKSLTTRTQLRLHYRDQSWGTSLAVKEPRIKEPRMKEPRIKSLLFHPLRGPVHHCVSDTRLLFESR
jgi:hypothetical protein